MATLTSVKIHVDVQDGVDWNSTVLFQLYHITQATVIASLSASSIDNNIGYDGVLNLLNNTLNKNQINETTFYLEINADGHDTFNGNLNISFTYSDGTTNAFGYGGFQIGTYHMSNSTRKQVQVA